MLLYTALARLNRPKTFTGKILFISFVGVHVPLLVLVGYLLLASPLSIGAVTPILAVVLGATLMGTAATLWAVYALLAPIREASHAIRAYLSEKRVSALPTTYNDEAGQLMADVQQGITHLDSALGAAYASRDAAVQDRQAKFDLLSKMSHEMRTPLNHILGFSEILQHEMLGPLGQSSYKGYATDINASGANLLSLVQAILDISQLEAGRYEMATQSVDVRPIVESVLGLGHFQAEKSGIELRNELSRRADLPMANADERALKQMLRGILSVSLQSTPEGGVITIDGYADRKEMRLSLTDTGSRLTGNDIPTVLADAFAPGSAPAASSVTGGPIDSVSPIGLGLAVVHSLAKLHGGALEIVHSAGSGKVITLVLPLADRAAEPIKMAA